MGGKAGRGKGRGERGGVGGGEAREGVGVGF